MSEILEGYLCVLLLPLLGCIRKIVILGSSNIIDIYSRLSVLSLQLELFLSSGTVCISIYSLIAGIFGMNIPYTWNDDHGYMFKWVSIEIENGVLAINFNQPFS